ncbi:class E sortase [Streptomyces wuyuanensis]|uniref:class E sortase n=1 Tax=Streptomyces wuyuanensis TaxID=1196353 RepID=UPI003435370E
MHPSRSVPTALAAALVVVLAAGCSAASGGARTSDKPASAAGTSSAAAPVPESRPSPSPPPATALAPASVPSPGATPRPPGSARTQPAALSIPSIGVADLRVVPYEGTTDDRPGTRIQDRGVAASPYGERGGVGPGEVGNYLVTAHRLSAGGPLRDLTSLGVGDPVLVTSGGRIYEYRITEHRTTSFRSARSLAEQRAAVPGFPGRTATRPMITISTCATPEDNAAGNFWRDDRNNPEHRIDRVGVLTGVREAAG